MSDEQKPPEHNFEPIKKIADEMIQHAGLWSRDVGLGDKQRDAVMVCAFTLRQHMEDLELRVLIVGLMAVAKVPMTERSREFTQLIHYAFHDKKKLQPEPSQISRWASALEFAWSCDPRPEPSEVPKFISSKGGTAECAKKVRQKASQERAAERAAQAKPEAIPVDCNLPDELDGEVVTARKVNGAWQLEPRKVLALATTLEPGEREKEPATAAPN
jgi:hypothetical protein